MTTTAPAPAPSLASFRYVGTSDQDVCDRCGKPELRSTIVLAALDADGNVDEYVAFGSTCAARALGVRGDGRNIRALADAAHERLRLTARDALEFLAFVGVDVQGRPMFTRDGITRVWGPAALRYRMANPVGPFAHRVGTPVEEVQAAVARKLAILADARRVGILTD